MTERCVCQVLNADDEKTMTITTEWSNNDEVVKVMVFGEARIPLYGQTTLTHQLGRYARPGVSREQALVDMRKELSGGDSEVRFVLREAKLLWKKKAWWKGGVEMRPMEDIVFLADTTLRWLTECASLKSLNAGRRLEIAALEKSRQELIAELQAVEDAKKRMEDDLYAKFLVILNEKKKRIRELEATRATTSRVPGSEGAAYDEDTDDSEGRSQAEAPSPDLLVRANGNTAFKLEFSSESEQEEMILKYEDTRSMDTDDDENNDLFS